MTEFDSINREKIEMLYIPKPPISKVTLCTKCKHSRKIISLWCEHPVIGDTISRDTLTEKTKNCQYYEETVITKRENTFKSKIQKFLLWASNF